jgi:hypothetical protein
LAKIQASGIFAALYCTDSLPQVTRLAKATGGKFLRVLPVAGVIADFFRAS